MIDRVKMAAKAAKFGLYLTEEQLQNLDSYANLLVDWNTRMNLTGITDSKGIMTRHFEDSMTMLHAVSIAPNAKVIDVGTGAGFPGMVLKIVRPDIQLTLLDSLNKRILFLNEGAEALHFEVETLHLRAEDGSRKSEYREQFDIACARAVANLRELSEYCLPYVKIGGQFVSMKGPEIQDEVDSARPGIGTLGGKIKKVEELTLSDGSGRSIIVIEKKKATPPRFPRAAGKITKKPL